MNVWIRRARVFGSVLAICCAFQARPASAQVPHGFGQALAGGNFNGVKEGGDLFQGGDELVVGSPNEPTNGPINAGIVYVYVKNGNAIWSLLGDFQPPAWNVFMFDQSYFGAGDGGRELGDGFGSSFAVGDFNGDGKKDLAIGVPAEDLPGKENAGCVHILFGANNSGTLWPFREKAYLTRASATGFLPVSNVPAEGDLFGMSLAAGDFNGDGTDDLAVGAPGVTINGLRAAGAVFVFHARALSPPSNQVFPAWGEYTFFEGGGYAGLITGPAAADEYFGMTLAAGNFNADVLGGRRLFDLAVSAPNETVGSNAGAGKVFVFQGSSTRLNNNSALPPQTWSQQNVPGASPEPGDAFGTSLAAGNFNHGAGLGDPQFEVVTLDFHDLAIGAPWEDINYSGTSYVDAGIVQVLYGYKSGLRTTAAPTSDPDSEYSHASQTFHRATVTGSAPHAGGLFGRTLAAGDVLNQNGGCQGNACNPDDLVIGESGDSGTGAAIIIDGLPLTSGLTTQSWKMVVPDPASQWPQFSQGMAVLRLGLGRTQQGNAPGALARDLVIGAPGVSRLYTYFGRVPQEFTTQNIAQFPYPQSASSPPF